MKPIVFSLFNHEKLAKEIQKEINADFGNVLIKAFPDGETYIQLKSPVLNRPTIIVDSLDHPNPKMAPLLFLSETLKQEGASQVALVSPYLSYMRQDKQFNTGEGVTSKQFAQFLSNHFDWLVTVDPHLHRYKSMSELYSMPTQVVQAAPNIAQWIQENVNHPVLIGPDSESKQWVSDIASRAKAPFTVLHKDRYGDRDVKISIPDPKQLHGKTPVLVDDIISTGTTMIKTVLHLNEMNTLSPICIGIHGIFAQHAYQDLLEAGAERIITCNTIPHKSNTINVSNILSEGVLKLL